MMEFKWLAEFLYDDEDTFAEMLAEKSNEDAIREQFAGSSWIIYQKTGKPVTSLAYPSGDYNERVMRIAREYYEFAYTTDATSYWGQDPMMLPRYAIYRDHTIHTFRNFVE